MGDIGALLALVEELEDALGRATADWMTLAMLAGLGDRHRELARVLDERLHVAEAHLARWRPGCRR
jgi:hypothetical protein